MKPAAPGVESSSAYPQECGHDALTACATQGILYEELLGPGWQQLHGAIRQLHTPGEGLQVKGAFRVMHGRHRAAALLARLLRFPPETEKILVRLQITPSGAGELWRRMFDRRAMVSHQTSGGPGILKENIGLLEMRFRLTAVGGSLIYQQSEAGLRIRSRFVPLPRWMRPIVQASEQAGDGSNSVMTSVAVSLPRIGLLLSYAGWIEILENQA